MSQKEIIYSIINNEECKENDGFFEAANADTFIPKSWSLAQITETKIKQSVADALIAFKTWKRASYDTRVQILNKWEELLLKHKESLAKSLSGEISKSYSDSLTEIERSVDFIHETIKVHFSMHGTLYDGQNNNKPNKIGAFINEPIGVILAISPFNYPINLSISKLAPAIITNNVVIFKPPTIGSRVSVEMIKLLIEAGLPKGVIQTIIGKGSSIGNILTTHEDINLINFTGSTNIGKSILEKSVFKEHIFELGGKDGCLVLKDADLEKAASEIVKGAFSYNGQRCTAIKKVIVDSEVYNKLVTLLKHKLEKLKVGSTKDNSDITPLINIGAAEYLKELIEDAKNKGATIVFGGKFINPTLLEPTLIIDVTKDMRIFIEEQFGPILPIIKGDDNWEHNLDLMNSSEYGLQASIFTNNIQMFWKYANNIDAARINFNSATSRGPDYFPFTGFKKSGLGEQGIGKTLSKYIRSKGIVFNF